MVTSNVVLRESTFIRFVGHDVKLPGYSLSLFAVSDIVVVFAFFKIQTGVDRNRCRCRRVTREWIGPEFSRPVTFYIMIDEWWCQIRMKIVISNSSFGMIPFCRYFALVLPCSKMGSLIHCSHLQ